MVVPADEAGGGEAPAEGPSDGTGQGRRGRAAGLAVILLLSAVLAVWGAFLVPLHVGGVFVPVSWAIAGVGNAALVLAAGRLAGRVPSILPAAVWFVVAVLLGSPRGEGDIIVPGTYEGLGFLVSGSISAIAAFAVVTVRSFKGPTS